MQWHWGNIGSALAGLSTVIIAVAALIRSPSALRDWRARQRAQAEAAHEETRTLQLERRRGLSGWNAMGVNTYPVVLVTAAGELDQARTELVSGQPTAYVVLRITGATEGGSANLALGLRQTIEAEGYISRPPTTGECEALEKGLDAMGIPHAGGHRAEDAQSAAPGLVPGKPAVDHGSEDRA
jgi:hypothetical protein